MPRVTFSLIIAALLAGFAVVAPAFAKLPAPSDEAKAKAAAVTAKTAWTDKLGAYQLCVAQNRVAGYYRNGPAAASAPPAVETPACTAPDPFVAPVATPPLEAAGAHSPATIATSPPSSKATATELQGQPKK